SRGATINSSEDHDNVPHAHVTIVDHGKGKRRHDSEDGHQIPVSHLQALVDSGKGRVEPKAEKSARIAKMTDDEATIHGID
ncbi:hypothetical protein U2065_14885, partial [Listeria monocytogenes]|uniref:hypothetical protein n=1 Tax=Listeria monocytogenes TaxID=1639 RepID=UPI002FDBA204